MPVHEREQSDGVARADSGHSFAATRGGRRDHELEACVAQSDRSGKRAFEAVEHRLTVFPEPRFPVQVVGGDKGPPSVEVFYHPVIAATPEGRVLNSFDIETPTVGQAVDQRADLQLLRWGRPHFYKSNCGFVRVRIRVWTSSRNERTRTMQRDHRC